VRWGWGVKERASDKEITLPPTIYISSSWKNRERVRELADLIRDAGYDVYDFTDPRCRKTPEIPPEKFPEQFDPAEHVYGEYLQNPAWREAVEENKKALDRCAAVVLLLPCGIDATADWAYAVGLGKKSVVIGHPPAGERSPVHLWANAMVEQGCEVVEYLRSNVRNPDDPHGHHM
jgi:glutaminase